MTKTVCYFGIFDENFSRSRVIIKGLKAQGIDVKVCNDRTPSLKKYWNLIKKHRQVGAYDQMIVGFPGYFTVFFAKMLTRKPIVFDAYISYYDGLLDRHNYSKWHPRMIIAWLVDHLGCRVANKSLTINDQYRNFFIKTIRVPSRKMFVLRKGADTDVMKPTGRVTTNRKFTVGWWGTFIPLHGVEYILDAAERLENEDLQIVMIGRGQLKVKTEKEVADRNLRNISMLAPVPYAELPSIIESFDIVLGIFNPTDKALRCITNKVYEAIALGKTVVTEDSLAAREILKHGETAYLIPPGSGEALAKAIIELKSNSALRISLGRNAKNLFDQNFTPEKIGANLLEILES